MCGEETILLCYAGHNRLAEAEQDGEDTGNDEKTDDDTAVPGKLISAKGEGQGEETKARRDEGSTDPVDALDASQDRDTGLWIF